MDRKEARRVTAQTAVKAIQSGDRIVLPLCCGMPQTLMDALIDDHERLENVEIVSGLQVEYPFLGDGLEGSFSFRTWQCAPPIRHHIKNGRVKYIPMRQGDAVRVFARDGEWPIDVALIHVSPPDTFGYCSLGVSIGHSLPLALGAKIVIAEVNAQMPYVMGKGLIHISDIDFLVESDRALLEYGSSGSASEQDMIIGKYVADLIPDGATIQVGIGGIPDAVVKHLEGKKDLGFYAMGIDRIVDLVEKGAVREGKYPSIIVTEILGTQKIFDFVDRNPMIEGRTLDETINPRVAGNIPKFCSILSTIEMDLTGQINSETVNGKQLSAIGGSFDFLQGALYAEGGRSIIAMTSTTPNGKASRIVPRLPVGSAVTIPRHSVDYVVTEYGVARMFGKSLRERINALIDIAHPSFRDQLSEESDNLF